MTSSSPKAGSQPQQGKTVASNTKDVNVNVQELTDRVYRLFLKDLETQRKRLYGTRR